MKNFVSNHRPKLAVVTVCHKFAAMTFRLLRWLHRHGISRKRLKGSLVHRWMGNSIFSRELWAFRRESLARGWLIGSLVAATPLMGLQMLLGLPAGIYFRANLFVVTALVLTTNPLTAVVFYPFCFMIGCWCLGRQPEDFHWDNAAVWKAGGPLFLGCTVVGLLVGLTGFLLIRRLWRNRPPRPGAVKPGAAEA
ncbi:MAG: DUF2062 domain-containing protein [Verrucomicrobia bacterium]|nr:DUF2062 domain-containing protein [Verrucomicrobiota bacterium]